MNPSTENIKVKIREKYKWRFDYVEADGAEKVYSLTYSITNKYRDAKFACQIISNGMSDILCGIYLEIIELHFCGLDKFLRRYIIKREKEDKNK